MTKKMPRRNTIKDVAKVAGVSWMTVSRVVNQSNHVSDATRKVVQSAIAKLGYVPNKSAVGLHSDFNKFVALVLPDLSSTIFQDIYRGLNEVLEQAGYLVLVSESHYQAERELALVEGLLNWQPAGFVFSNILRDSQTGSKLSNSGVPVCLLSDPDFPTESLVVGYSSFRIGAAIARFLFKLGKTRVSYVRATKPYTRNSERMLAGAKSILPEFPGCRVETIGIPKTSPLSFDDGAAVIRSLKNGTQSACDALVFVNDVPAAGAVFECLRVGIQIPQDLAIIGFGDSDLASQLSPGLTTVHVEANRIGRIAGELLLADIDQVEWKNRKQEVGFKLVVRETT